MSSGPHPYDLHFTGEARRRMYERDIAVSQVRQVLRTGQVLRRYPDDKPLPSYLMVGWVSSQAQLGTYDKGRPIHVVAADAENRTEVITTYEPDPNQWEDDFRWRTRWKSEKDTWRETDD